MDTRTNWGIVVFAIAFALVVIGVATGSAYFQTQSEPSNTNIAATQGDLLPERGTTEEWRVALDAIATKAAADISEYRAPEELGATPSVSHELVAMYLTLKKEGTLNTPVADDALKELINRNVSAIVPSDEYTLSSIRTNPSITLEAYAGVVGTAMEKSASVQEYELATFARTVGTEDYNGTPELAAAAGIYRTIERELANAQVPPALTSSHLAVIKSVAYMAQSTELMGGWSGDPIDALAYVDAFAKAERDAQVAFNSLFTAMVNLGKQL